MENLKNGTKIKWGSWNLVITKCNGKLTIEDYDDIGVTFEASAYNWTNGDFKILEDEEIDIDKIEEFKFGEIEDKNNYETRYKINELIKAVKQLNKKRKE